MFLPHILTITVLGFVSTSLDNLVVLALLFATKQLRPARIAAAYLAVSAAVAGLGWTASVLVESARADLLDSAGWLPIALGARAAWQLRYPTGTTPEDFPLPGGEPAAALVLLATSADNLLIALVIFGHAPAPVDPILFVTLTGCSAAWCALAFWLARRSRLAPSLQRGARPLLPFLLIGMGAYMLIHR